MSLLWWLGRELAIAYDIAKNLIVRRPIGSIVIGYLVVTPRRYPGFRALVLCDGTVVRRGDKIARLDVKLKLPRLEGSELRYARRLYPSFAAHLTELALRAQHDPRLAEVRAFVGQSHLVGRLTEKLGLETRPIGNPLVRAYADLGGRGAMLIVDPSWRGLRKVLSRRIHPAREAWISKTRLIDLFTCRV